MPWVTLSPPLSASALPTAITWSPTSRSSELPSLTVGRFLPWTFSTARSYSGALAQEVRRFLGAVAELDLDPAVGTLDDVAVRDDHAVGRHDESGSLPTTGAVGATREESLVHGRAGLDRHHGAVDLREHRLDVVGPVDHRRVAHRLVAWSRRRPCGSWSSRRAVATATPAAVPPPTSAPTTAPTTNWRQPDGRPRPLPFAPSPPAGGTGGVGPRRSRDRSAVAPAPGTPAAWSRSGAPTVPSARSRRRLGRRDVRRAGGRGRHLGRRDVGGGRRLRNGRLRGVTRRGRAGSWVFGHASALSRGSMSAEHND